MLNFNICREIFALPFGNVEMGHFQKLLELDELDSTSLRRVPKFSQAHINPNHWQKMNVGLATQVSFVIIAHENSFNFFFCDIEFLSS